MRPKIALLAPPNNRLSRRTEIGVLGELIAVTLGHTESDFIVDVSDGVLDAAALAILKNSETSQLLGAYEFRERHISESDLTRRMRTCRKDLRGLHHVFQGRRASREQCRHRVSVEADLVIMVGSPQIPPRVFCPMLAFGSTAEYCAESLIQAWLVITNGMKQRALEAQTPRPAPPSPTKTLV